MEIFILIVIVLVIFVFVLPLVAIGRVSAASRNVEDIQRQIDRLTTEIEVYRRVPPTIEILKQRLLDLEERCAILEVANPTRAATGEACSYRPQW